MWAAQYGRTASLQVLIQAGAKVDQADTPEPHRPDAPAAEDGCTAILQALIQEPVQGRHGEGRREDRPDVGPHRNGHTMPPCKR